MTRHAKNCTAGAVYTYHEKKKDAAASGYGTDNQRIGKDSVKDFDCCCLTLQPCHDPVITPDGYLYEKEAILEYILKKKVEYNKKLKEYDRQKKKEQTELAELEDKKQMSKLKTFISVEKNIVTERQNYFKDDSKAQASTISNIAPEVANKLPSFWIPSMTPEAQVSKIKKPDKTIYCPMSGKPLKMKNLIPVVFTKIKDLQDKESILVKKDRYMCPITHDILRNSVPAAVLKPTGDVVTLECVEKIIKKEWIHPLTNQKIKESDIILLQRGGTGYSQTNEKLEGKNERPVLQA